MIKEFREFVMRGNVLDLAIGVIIGGAFGKIVSSLVADIITPILSLVLGGINLSENKIELRPGIFLTWGNFTQSIIDFLIIAFVIFLIVKAANNMKKAPAPAAPAEPTTKECPHCITTISIKATRCPNCTSELK